MSWRSNTDVLLPRRRQWPIDLAASGVECPDSKTASRDDKPSRILVSLPWRPDMVFACWKHRSCDSRRPTVVCLSTSSCIDRPLHGLLGGIGLLFARVCMASQLQPETGSLGAYLRWCKWVANDLCLYITCCWQWTQ